jgi:hypothetical protein
MSPAKKFKARQMDSGLAQRGNEGVGLPVRRDSYGEGPPELRRVEADRLDGGRAFQQRGAR